MMTKSNLLIAAILGLTAVGTSESFTNSAGKTIEGKIVDADTKADSVTIHVTKVRKDFQIKISTLAPDSQKLVQAWWNEKHPQPAEWVKPGASKKFEFPDLPESNHDNGTATASVYVPTEYQPDQEVPLMVWLTGGKGGNGINGAQAVAGKEKFVCVSLPYPAFDGRDVFSRQRDGGLVEFWTYHKTMLDAIQQEIPNIHPTTRAIAGFSNGAHTIGGYLGQVEDEFADSFSIFVFGDGGVHSGDWARKNFKDDFSYVLWGEISDNKDMGLATAEACESAGMRVTKSEMAETGHKFTPEEKEKVKEWILGTVLPTLEKEAAEK